MPGVLIPSLAICLPNSKESESRQRGFVTGGSLNEHQKTISAPPGCGGGETDWGPTTEEDEQFKARTASSQQRRIDKDRGVCILCLYGAAVEDSLGEMNQNEQSPHGSSRKPQTPTPMPPGPSQEEAAQLSSPGCRADRRLKLPPRSTPLCSQQHAQPYRAAPK